MPTQIGENRVKKMLKNDELVLCMGVNQLRSPNIAMIAAACGFDAVYIDLEHTRPRSRPRPGCASRPWAWASPRLPASPRTTRMTRPASSIAAPRG
jgi:hypothetical protein